MHILYAFIWACKSKWSVPICMRQEASTMYFPWSPGSLTEPGAHLLVMASLQHLPTTHRHQHWDWRHLLSCPASPQVLEIRIQVSAKLYSPNFLPRPFTFSLFLNRKTTLSHAPSLSILSVSYIRWLLIDKWSNTVGCSYLSHPHLINRTNTPISQVLQLIPLSLSPVHSRKLKLFILTLTISSPPPQSSASWVLVLSKWGLSLRTPNTTDIYSAGPHSAQGPLVTSVCLSKCPLQLTQGLTLQPKLSGSSSPDWPRTLEFLLLWLQTWKTTLGSSQHFKSPPFCFLSSATFFWPFPQPPVRLLLNFFLFRQSLTKLASNLGVLLLQPLQL